MGCGGLRWGATGCGWLLCCFATKSNLLDWFSRHCHRCYSNTFKFKEQSAIIRRHVVISNKLSCWIDFEHFAGLCQQTIFVDIKTRGHDMNTFDLQKHPHWNPHRPQLHHHKSKAYTCKNIFWDAPHINLEQTEKTNTHKKPLIVSIGGPENYL